MLAALLAVILMTPSREAESSPTRRAREHMVALIAQRGVDDAAVLAAMRRFPRHELVPEAYRNQAYDDGPLPIGFGQTISQPYMVAYMTEAADVQPGEKVLEVGTGSGYQAAILALVGARVFTIEIVPELGERARRDLARLSIDNVTVRVGDGYRGWPEEAPFDAIVVTAAPLSVPPPLLAQLADRGRLVIPVGELGDQTIEIHQKHGDRVDVTRSFPVRFVPMTGEAEH
ncbi:MAG: protein-L-isoaspartate(D-aspartate) O-methyltransferase [Myxococcota bacterium]